MLIILMTIPGPCRRPSGGKGEQAPDVKQGEDYGSILGKYRGEGRTEAQLTPATSRVG